MSDLKPILYVDDEPQNLTVFEAAFEDDYAVHLAASGVEALEILRREPIHLVVTDMRMPGMTGVELLERMIPDYPDTIRIILTGYTDLEAIVQAINAGRLYQYITKPWAAGRVRQVIDGALAQYASVMERKTLLARLVSQEQEERALRAMFQRYVPPGALEKVLARDKGAELADAEEQTVTLLFADVRDFTSLCSGLEPHRVLTLMNGYFDAMADVVYAHRGTVTHYLGDGLLAMFGAPADEDDAGNAARAALAMVEALAEFNRTVARELVGRDLVVGIAIHRGPVVVGSMGSPAKLVYSAVGETLTQIWQIESSSKGHDNAILIGPNARARLADRFDLTDFAELALAGQEMPAAISRLTGFRPSGREPGA